MSQEVLLVIVGGVVGGTVGIVSSLVTAMANNFFERRRLAAERKHELQNRKREHQLAVLREKNEPALNMFAAVLKAIETCKNGEEAFDKLQALGERDSYWFVWARLTDDRAKEYYSMVIRYNRIKESEEQWQAYKAQVVSASKKLSELYDKKRERLFGEDNTVN